MLPEIQGLRAIAVAVVILFHFWPTALPGGFVGVDVFFVISGFLITGHICREVEAHGRVRVVQFWARRIRRLLPASLLVLAVVGVVTVLVVPLSNWASFFRNIGGSAIYVQNWVLATDAVDYWAQSAATPPTQHYWSLSVEEQFYLVWPLLFALISLRWVHARFGLRRTALVLMGAVVILGFAYSVWFSFKTPSVAYFSTFTRSWEFALGGVIGVTGTLTRMPDWIRGLIAWFGIVLIAISVLFLSEKLPFPGYAAVLPVVGTALVIMAGTVRAPWSVSVFSSIRPIRYVGDISYSLYLWHWPILILAPFIIGPVHFVAKIALLVLTLVLAALTKKFVEDPARRWKWLAIKRSVPTFALAAVVSGLLVLTSVAAPGWASTEMTSQIASANKYATSSQSCVGASAALTENCDVTGKKPAVPSADIVFQNFNPEIEKCFSQDDNPALIECKFGVQDGATKHVALVGDSHAGAIAPALMRLAREQKWDLRVFLKPGCTWAETVRYRQDGNQKAQANCTTWREKVDRRLVEGTKFDAVVTTSYALVTNSVVTQDGNAYGASVTGLRKTWTAFHAANPAPVFVIRDDPNWPDSAVTCLQQASSADQCTETPDRAFSFRDPQIEAAQGQTGVDLIDFSDVYCPKGTCRSVIGGITVYRDQHHLSEAFALTLAPVLLSRMQAAVPGDGL